MDLLGLKAYYIESLGLNNQVDVVAEDGTRYTSGVWRDMLEATNDKSKILYRYSDEFANYAAASQTRIGQGLVIHIATAIEDEEFWLNLVRDVLAIKGIKSRLTPDGVEIIRRGKTDFILNHNAHSMVYANHELKAFDVVMLEHELTI